MKKRLYRRSQAGPSTGHVFFSTALMVMMGMASFAQSSVAWRDQYEFHSFHVVVPRDAGPERLEAARIFKDLWRRCTRREISISAINQGDTNVWLGRDLVPPELMDTEPLAQAGREAFMVLTYTPPRRYRAQGADKQLFIVGSDDRGVLHGVYEFFFQAMNVRWIEPGVLRTPPVGMIAPMQMEGRPVFSFRDTALHLLWQEGLDAYRMGHKMSPVPESLPGNMDTFVSVASGPPPENSIPEITPLALGTPKAAEQVLQSILQMAGPSDGLTRADLEQRKARAAWPSGVKNSWSLSRMDWLKPFLSDEGRRLNESEQTPAAALLDLANRVAEGLERALPGERHHVHILLAPEIRRSPVTMRAHPNVIVQLSNRDCDFSRPISDASNSANRAFVADLSGWQRTNARLYVLDHVTNMKDPQLPFPNLPAIASNMLWYAHEGVEGVYVLCGPGKSSEEVDLAALRSYLVSSLLWNPDSPAEEHFQDFLKAYYGLAAPHIRGYLDAMEAAQRRTGAPLTVVDTCDWLDAGTLNSLLAMLDAAEVPHLQEIQLGRIHSLRKQLEQVGERLGWIPPRRVSEDAGDG